MPISINKKRKSKPGISANKSLLLLMTMLLISIPVFGFVKSRPPLDPYSTHGIGQKAVEFSWTDIKGAAHSLKAHKDKGLFLYFFTPDLPACRQDLGKLEKVYSKYKPTRGESFEFLGICVGCDNDKAMKTAEALNLAIPIIADPNKRAVKAYGLSVLPVSLVVSQWRTVKYEHLGPIGDMEQTFFGPFERYLGIRLGIWRFRHGTKQEQEDFKKTLSPSQKLKVFDVHDPQISSIAKTVPCICDANLRLDQCRCDQDYKTAMYRWINFFILDGSFTTEQITQILQWKYEGIVRTKQAGGKLSE